MKDDQLLAQKPFVDLYLGQGPCPLSSFSFVSLFAWCDFFDFELQMIKDCLCIFAHGATGTFLYLPPLGGNFRPSMIPSVFEHMAKGSKLKAVNRIENIPEYSLSKFAKDSYNQHLKPAEYVYRKEDLIALKGNAYKSKRHDCNYFLSHHAGCSFEAYTDADFEACMGLYEHWANDRARSNSDDIYKEMLKENRRVHERLLRFLKPLGLVVRVLRRESAIIGYTFGYPLDKDTFCIYAEIADLKQSGAAAYMFRSFCGDDQLKDFSRINTMDDFAMPKVAQAKQAYHPSELINSYTVSMKE